jgi:hypothetical protein
MLNRTIGTLARKRRKAAMASVAVAAFAVAAGVTIPAFAADEHCVGKDTGSACVSVTPAGWDVAFGGWVADRPGDGLFTEVEIAMFSTGSSLGRAVQVLTPREQVPDNDPPRQFEGFHENVRLPVTHIKVAVCSRETDEVPDCVQTGFIEV